MHSLHTSGWADGTLLNGERGWFPSNYCEPHTLGILVPLTDARTSLANVVLYGKVADYPQVVGVIVSQVRLLLVETNCLTRESPLIRQHELARRDRKVLLSELSALVNLAKRDQDYLETAANDLLLRSEKVLSRACRFIHSIGSITGIYAAEAARLASVEVTPTPPVSYDFSTPTIPEEEEAEVDSSSNMGHVDHSQVPAATQSALSQLDFSHSTLLSHLAAFIGRLHLQSQLQSATHILLATRQCVNAARALLACLESISTYHPDHALTICKDHLYTDITKLVTRARHTVDLSDGSVMETQRLVDAATGVVRGSGSCTLRARHLIETYGDFECPKADEEEGYTSPCPISRDETSSSLASLVDRRQSKDVQSQVELLQIPYKKVAKTSPRIASDVIPEAAQSSRAAALEAEATNQDTLDADPKEIPEPTSPGVFDAEDIEVSINQDGQIIGGTIAALVMNMTPHDMMPDPSLFSSFFLTFRLFVDPRELAQVLVSRFAFTLRQQDSTCPAEHCMPIRLRVYNVFKSWLESYWRPEHDHLALSVIQEFAGGILLQELPQAAKRLSVLVRDLADDSSMPLTSLLGKTTIAGTPNLLSDTPPPPPLINKGQIAALRASTSGGPSETNAQNSCSILDFDELEIARQFTIMESKMFCAIGPIELVGQEFSKKQGSSLALNVKAMSAASTDLASWVADSILWETEQRRRTSVLKHWIKIGERCAQLRNYNTLMAIMCALNSSTIARLKRTWDGLNRVQKSALEQLRLITDHQRNYAVYRSNIRQASTPCLPFLGLYLTDLVFVDEGNPSYRPSRSSGRMLINFDKHQKSARIISELQRFQVPYKLQEVPELSAWITASCLRMRKSAADLSGNLWRRSLIIEPKLPTAMKREPSIASDNSENSLWSNKKLNFLTNW